MKQRKKGFKNKYDNYVTVCLSHISNSIYVHYFLFYFICDYTVSVVLLSIVHTWTKIYIIVHNLHEMNATKYWRWFNKSSLSSSTPVL